MKRNTRSIADIVAQLSVPEGALVENVMERNGKVFRYYVKHPKNYKVFGGNYRLESVSSSHVRYVTEGELLNNFRMVHESGKESANANTDEN